MEKKKNIDLRSIGIKELSLSPLMMNREKIETEELIGQPLTLVGVDMVTTRDKRDGEDKTYPVCVFEEYPDRFYFGGFLLKKLINVWAAMDEFNGDYAELSNYLAETGGIKIKFKGKNGQTTVFDIL